MTFYTPETETDNITVTKQEYNNRIITDTIRTPPPNTKLATDTEAFLQELAHQQAMYHQQTKLHQNRPKARQVATPRTILESLTVQRYFDLCEEYKKHIHQTRKKRFYKLQAKVTAAEVIELCLMAKITPDQFFRPIFRAYKFYEQKDVLNRLPLENISLQDERFYE